ncbi:MAG: glycosyltransferase family 39 protein [Deltaproteobacteria bacterium]|jgi:hypothetical protein|nr:glycosyltransferase family 39 protein [Deltaproteobacteria bacterium]MBW2533157.1 glycosyltransferase family 39 protein [Deltaproteobacteria bacterium]
MDRTGLEWAYEAGSIGMLYQTRVLQAAYLALALWLFLWAIRSRRRLWAALRGPGRREALWLAAMVAFGFALRMMAPASPMDIHNRLQPAFHAWLVPAPYGWGTPVLAVMLWQLFGRSYDVVFTAAALVGAASLVPLHLLARRVGLSESGRFWAVLVMATMPLHVRFSHTDNQSIVEIALLLVALCALLSWAERPRYRSALLAGLSLGVAMCARPEACVLALVGLAWIAFVRHPARLHLGQALAAIAVLVVVAGVHALAMTHLLMTTEFAQSLIIERDVDLLHRRAIVFFDGQWVSPALWLGLGLSPLARRLSVRVRVGLWAIALSLALLLWSYAPTQLGLLAARHQLRALPFVALLTGAGLGVLSDRSVGVGGRLLALRGAVVDARRMAALRAARSAALLAIGAALLLGLPAALRPTTLNLEWAFFRRALAAAPPCCTMTLWSPDDDRSLMSPTYLSETIAARHRWVSIEGLDELRVAEDECLLYYRPASCYAHDVGREVPPPRDGLHRMVPVCAEWEAQRQLRPWHTARLPPRTTGTDHFGAGALQVGFFSLGDHGAAERSACWDARFRSPPGSSSWGSTARAAGRGAWSPELPGQPPSERGDPARKPWNACGFVFTPAHAEELYPELQRMPSAPCRFASLDIVGHRCQVSWQGPEGEQVSATLLPASCVGWRDTTDLVGPDVALLAAPEAVRVCPAGLDALREMVRSGAVPAPTSVGP